MCQSNIGHPDQPEEASASESAEYWRARFENAEAHISRLSARLRGRDQRLLLLERALARTVALHHSLEDSLEQRLEQCLGQIAQETDSARSSVASEIPASAGVVVRLPHLSRTLEVLFIVMREYWTQWDPDHPPKSSTVARAIDMKLGLKGQSSGEASRSAQTFAAALRPDSLNEADGRHH
jgi:hypothetical protein